MSSLSDKIAENRRKEEESARAQQEESSTEAEIAEKQRVYNTLYQRFSGGLNDLQPIVNLVFQTNDDGTMADNFDIDSFVPEHAIELINAFEHMLDTLEGEPKTRRILFARKQKEPKEEKIPRPDGHRFSLDPRDWGLLQWLPAIAGVLVLLGIASATKDWFVQDWVKVTDDTLSSVLTVLWVGVWLGIGFFGGPALVQLFRSRFGRSGSD